MRTAKRMMHGNPGEVIVGLRIAVRHTANASVIARDQLGEPHTQCRYDHSWYRTDRNPECPVCHRTGTGQEMVVHHGRYITVAEARQEISIRTDKINYWWQVLTLDDGWMALYTPAGLVQLEGPAGSFAVDPREPVRHSRVTRWVPDSALTEVHKTWGR